MWTKCLTISDGQSPGFGSVLSVKRLDFKHFTVLKRSANPVIAQYWYSDVFRDTLPDGLPPQRSVDHQIETLSESRSNRNAYQLSVIQLEEQPNKWMLCYVVA